MNIGFQRIVVNICRMALFATFVFSGLVKLIDPLGTAYKIHDYAVALHLEAWMPEDVATALAVVLALLEFLIGIYFFFGMRRRFASYGALFLLVLFTPLTLWLAITHAVTDCGCFGDAVHLTGWQTFGKNIFALACACVVAYKGDLMPRFISQSSQWIVSLYSILFGGMIAFTGLHDLPVFDFRPYHIGQNIPKAMEWPEDPEQQPQILDFYMETPEEGDITEAILTDTSYVFLLIAPNLAQADDSNIDRINNLADYSKEHAYRFLCLTASGQDDITRWQDLTGAEYPFAFTDELTLKTMIRSNPGLMLLHNGTVINKWSHNKLPTYEMLHAPLQELPLAHPRREVFQRRIAKLILMYLVPLFLLTLLDRLFFGLLWAWRRHRNHPTEH